MHPSVRRLAQVLTPPTTGFGSLAWDTVEASWGTAFPSDYRDFIEVYGPGGIDDVISVATPESRTGEPGVLTVRKMTPARARTCRTFNGERQFSAWPAPGALLGWGVTPIGFDLFWRVTGADPDDWPVVVSAQRDSKAFEFPFGMAEFLVRMLGDTRDRPLGLRGILGHPHSRFVRAQEEHALLSSGQNPWEYLDEYWEERERARDEQGPVTWIAGPGRAPGDFPPVPRMVLEGFGVDGDLLRISATLDVEPGGSLLARVSIGSPDGVVVEQRAVAVAVERVNGLLVLDIRLPEAMNESGTTWREMVDAMSREEDWNLDVWLQDPAFGAARARHGIVVGPGMRESSVNEVVAMWPE
ncbi:hypothetical protein ACGF5O_37090 [Streptomyces sp. NPDC048291]|uniref:hypothetical protein n=1 Tax=Streptomyces sp. NPDC048291 TaxID=3365530 RepID=UPI00370F7DE1